MSRKSQALDIVKMLDHDIPAKVRYSVTIGSVFDDISLQVMSTEDTAVGQDIARALGLGFKSYSFHGRYVQNRWHRRTSDGFDIALVQCILVLDDGFRTLLSANEMRALSEWNRVFDTGALVREWEPAAHDLDKARRAALDYTKWCEA